MRFTISAAAFLAFAANVLAQNPNFDPVTKPLSQEKIAAGSTYTIEWTAPDAFKDVTVSISLIGGATQNTQVPLLDIASGVANSAGKYSWTIPSTLGKDAFYGLVIKSESNAADFQYSNPFHITASDSSSGTTTLTSSLGTATVTLSAASVSATPSASASASASAVASSSAPVVIANTSTALSTTAVPTPVSSAPATVVTSVTKPASNGTSTKTPSTTLATVTGVAGGARATAGVFAVLGGLAVAALL
ncbi:gpi anchored serine-threonine rich protein [Colletotrichum kahawae]|uniref:Gpi anchored serine-threonine rich protein n=1 Tax=Colletotrichum kahawae TaxID=34407 RepID=A0AAD9YJ88_COLKA|nr:gpi anchored serine-threonine rich protein [Colletotrichum kahawae]